VMQACEHGPPRARAALLRCLRGEISPPIAVLHFASEFEEASALLAFLSTAAGRLGAAAGGPTERLAALREFVESHRDGFALVRRMGAHHAQAMAELPATGVRAIRDLYDRLVELGPDTAVALYSFGDSRVLEAASAEVVAYLRERGLLSPATRLLEVGCGI